MITADLGTLDEWLEVGRNKTGTGPHGGKLVWDQEHPLGARLTLEAEAPMAPWALSCRVAGYLEHVVYFRSPALAKAAFAELKPRLETILGLVPSGPADREHLEALSAALVALVQDF